MDDVSSGGSSTAPGWVRVAQSDALVMGADYRLRLACMGRYDATTASKVKGVLTGAVGLNNALAAQFGQLRSMITIGDVRVSAPDTAQRTWAWPTFMIDIDFRKTGPGTPVVLVVGIIVAVILFALGLGFVVTQKEVFQRVQTAGQEVREMLSGSLVPLVLAAALFVYFLRR